MGSDNVLRGALILTAHQPGYLPWLGLIDKIAQADTYVSFDHVQYMPKEWQNRNRIKTANGQQWLTVPVLRKGYRDKPLNEIRIDNEKPWQRKHYGSLEQFYGDAPYYDEYLGALLDIYRFQWDKLTTLNETVLRWLLAELGVETTFLRASDYDFQGAKSDLVLDMCRQLGATTYIFGALGRDYADVAAFERAGIEVRFQNYHHPSYPQCWGGEFVPYMSVLDLLLNCGTGSLEILRGGQRIAA